jgi:RNase P/RNase MRP subunit p29
MLNGVNSPLVVKGNDNMVVIKIDESVVQVNSGSLTNFWMDVDAGRSIKKQGNTFELKPSVKIFSKEKMAGIEGRVLPKDASAIVMAINGTDTASAKPEAEGEFKFIGLKPGTYSLLYHATANNYRDTTVANIRINGTEDTKVNTVTLRK